MIFKNIILKRIKSVINIFKILKFNQLLKKSLVFIFLLINVYSASCDNILRKQKIDYKRHKLGSRGQVIELSCGYSCKIKKKKLNEPLGIYNESNFCYLISLLQILASTQRFYEISEVCSANENKNNKYKNLCKVFPENSYKNKIIKKLNSILKMLRSGLKTVKKKDLRELVFYFEKEGWLNEHGVKRKWNDPRDPSLLLKFILKSVASDNFKLTSIIQESDLNQDYSYCIDDGKEFYNVKPYCYLNEFPLEKLDNEILILISVYNDKDLNHSITHKTKNLVIPKNKANTKENIQYNASGFIQIKPNGSGGNHATSFVKRGKNWFHCNDDIIMEIDEDEIEKLISSEDTMLVIYERNCQDTECE